ncbi:class A beta-lactamase-related serine hydrolase [Patescibacteria group bacterium]|nr:class A beta-lactamase-related serine hydrolase [Patescibacteria group bacterium]
MNKKLIAGGIGLFAFGALLGFSFFPLFLMPKTGCVSEYKHINPEPDCEIYDERSEKLETLQANLESKVRELELRADIDHVAVFTRDLTSRRFAAVNDDRVFVLASLLKVPILIAYYKFAEVEPAILSDEVVYAGGQNAYDIQSEIPPEQQLIAGQRYSIDELLSQMIIYSDNAAADILLPRMTDTFMVKTLSSLGIQVEKKPGEKEALVTARTYANVFRGLYNASFLSREYSEKALSVLTQTTFPRGTRGALPSGVEVAEKFGERTNTDAQGNVLSRQLHDCGIVYANNGKTPYTFCIMTEGAEYGALEDAVQTLAKEIYKTLGD